MKWKIVLLVLASTLFNSDSKHFKVKALEISEGEQEITPYSPIERYSGHHRRADRKPRQDRKSKPSKRFHAYLQKVISAVQDLFVDNTFANDFLLAHNEYREKHGVPPLAISTKLNNIAENWAKTIAEKDKLLHSDQYQYGENLYYTRSSKPDFTLAGRVPVDKWYSEIRHYKFGVEPKTFHAGHFTQLIWKECTEVGVGVAKSKKGGIYVVANYNPVGNVYGSFVENVLPPIKT